VTAAEGRAEPAVIVITGPIASGKSTIARLVAAELERTQVRTAVIDLDDVHDGLTAAGAPSTDATWALARREAARLARESLGDGVAVVIAEGSFNRPPDRAAFAENLGSGQRPLYVTLQVTYEEALRRAELDPTRGRSRDPAFLGPYFASHIGEGRAGSADSDLVIDTDGQSATSAAATIAGLVRSTTFDAGQRVG
jgi:predicted kinase